jgi:hypothetical protein
MSRNSAPRMRPILLGAVLIVTAAAFTSAAGEHRFRPNRRAAAVRTLPTAAVRDPVYGPHLGTFFPTPGIVVQGNYPVGGGYAPLGIFGDQSLSLYGPTSALRTTTAPVLTYTRGYDGVARPKEAITSSYPNLPVLSPIAYPTRANHYYAPRVRENPASDSAIRWIDQN